MFRQYLEPEDIKRLTIELRQSEHCIIAFIGPGNGKELIANHISRTIPHVSIYTAKPHKPNRKIMIIFIAEEEQDVRKWFGTKKISFYRFNK